MNTARQIVHFCETVEGDARIGVTHISLYVALLREGIGFSFNSPFLINRQRLMQCAKISRKTYNTRINELHEYGYIRYFPSYDPLKGCYVYIQPLETEDSVNSAVLLK
jgi:replication initiation and membrane attachment protein DnaB